jgi:ubiquinone/menaquinone biosynthesis C-methylase UbiE
MNPAYLMESETEWERLLAKTDKETTREQLAATGFSRLTSTSVHVVDAGCGAGVVSVLMQEMLAQNYSASCLTLIDQSKERIIKAKTLLHSTKSHDISYVSCALEEIDLPSDSVDYIFCRFVFEYLSDPDLVLKELKRILKPGGKLVVGDLDYNCLTHYPISPWLEAAVTEIVSNLAREKVLDPHIGRKLFHMFHTNKLGSIKVHMWPHHLFAGKLPPDHLNNWLAKTVQSIDYLRSKNISLSFDTERFRKEFSEMLCQPDRLTYTPLLMVEGIKTI